MIGHIFGRKLFNNPDSRIFRQSHLEKTHEFYKKYGGKTILIARFVPIVRTFAPLVAGMGKMHYYYFMVYNRIGGTLLVGICLLYTSEFILNVLGTIDSLGSLESTFVMNEVKHEYGIHI